MAPAVASLPSTGSRTAWVSFWVVAGVDRFRRRPRCSRSGAWSSSPESSPPPTTTIDDDQRDDDRGSRRRARRGAPLPSGSESFGLRGGRFRRSRSWRRGCGGRGSGRRRPEAARAPVGAARLRLRSRCGLRLRRLGGRRLRSARLAPGSAAPGSLRLRAGQRRLRPLRGPRRRSAPSGRRCPRSPPPRCASRRSIAFWSSLSAIRLGSLCGAGAGWRVAATGRESLISAADRVRAMADDPADCSPTSTR